MPGGRHVGLYCKACEYRSVVIAHAGLVIPVIGNIMCTIEDKLKGRSILIVDDDPRNMFALVSYLEGLEMNIYTAEDGYRAIEMLDNSKVIEIVLMDMMMPEMDGYETIGRIRSGG